MPPAGRSPQTTWRTCAGFPTSAAVIVVTVDTSSGSGTLVAQLDLGYPATGSLRYPERAGAKAPVDAFDRASVTTLAAATDLVVLRAPIRTART
jgi:hypothetical protein